MLPGDGSTSEMVFKTLAKSSGNGGNVGTNGCYKMGDHSDSGFPANPFSKTENEKICKCGIIYDGESNF